MKNIMQALVTLSNPKFSVNTRKVARLQSAADDAAGGASSAPAGRGMGVSAKAGRYDFKYLLK